MTELVTCSSSSFSNRLLQITYFWSDGDRRRLQLFEHVQQAMQAVPAVLMHNILPAALLWLETCTDLRSKLLDICFVSRILTNAANNTGFEQATESSLVVCSSCAYATQTITTATQQDVASIRPDHHLQQQQQNKLSLPQVSG